MNSTNHHEIRFDFLISTASIELNQSLFVGYLYLLYSHLTFCSVWEAAIDALTAFVKCFASPNAVNNGILLQPVLVYLSRCGYFHGVSSHFLLLLIFQSGTSFYADNQ